MLSKTNWSQGAAIPMNLKSKLLWLFSGTSDGNRIAFDLIVKNYPVKVFVATQYGKKVASKTLPLEVIETGRLNPDQISERAKIEKPSQMIDATHPYAQEISKNLIHFCQSEQIPYLRYERPEETIEGENIYFADSVNQAAEKAKALGKKILLTLGSKNIESFLSETLKDNIYIRMLPDPSLIEHVLSKGVSPDRIIAIQGPFSHLMNRTMMEDFSIDCLVTKSSGNEGGILQKVSAAIELKIPVIIIKRPEMDYPVVFQNENKLIKHIVNKEQI